MEFTFFRDIFYSAENHISLQKITVGFCAVALRLALIIFNGDEYVYLRKYFGLGRKKEGAFGFECLHNSNFSWYS